MYQQLNLQVNLIWLYKEYCFPLRKSPTHILQLSHHLFPQHQLNIVPVIPGAEDIYVSVDDNKTNHAHALNYPPETMHIFYIGTFKMLR